ncbi:MAG: ShlB/FhaC/HecB family hemolysin secretion/activation protein [Symploca sp. SIO1B1]|nr:ShlB/FhaC/HecB family hemolysin secretion/activation protein [Symploca sp. SIO1B1]
MTILVQIGRNNPPVKKGGKAYCISFLTSCLLPPAFCLLLQTPNIAEPQPEDIPVNSSTDSPELLRFPIKEFRFQGSTLFSDKELQSMLQDYLGEDKTLGDLAAVEDSIFEAYNNAGYPLVNISFQRLNLEGIFQFKIIEFEVNRITVTGNQYFSEQGIRAALPELQEGSFPNLKTLSQQLFLANDNPSRQLVLNYQQQEAGKIDVEIQVKDQHPQRWGVRFNNRGTEATGNTRLSLITQNSNLFDRGHIAALSATISPEKLDQVQQFGFFYQVPLPTWEDTINFSASYSDVDSGRIADFFDVSGEGLATNLNWVQHISRTALDRQILDIGLGYRLFNNTVDFVGRDLGVDVAALPVSIAYQYSGNRGNNAFSTGIRYVRNIPGVVNRNNNQVYEESRIGANTNWDLWQIQGSYRYTWDSGWLLQIRGDSQYAGEPLISGEQFPFGGLYSIRGLQEREVAGDNGILASLEVYTPAIAYGNRFLAFTDFGQYWREEAQPGETESDSIWTVGLGWRWNYQNQFNAAVDVGYVLDGAPLSNSGEVRVHFSIGYSF